MRRIGTALLWLGVVVGVISGVWLWFGPRSGGLPLFIGIGLIKLTFGAGLVLIATGEVLNIEDGSLYPALRRLEDRGWVTSEWGLSENNRRARFYSITGEGRKHLRNEAATWIRYSQAVTRVLRAAPSLA